MPQLCYDVTLLLAREGGQFLEGGGEKGGDNKEMADGFELQYLVLKQMHDEGEFILLAFQINAPLNLQVSLGSY